MPDHGIILFTPLPNIAHEFALVSHTAKKRSTIVNVILESPVR